MKPLKLNFAILYGQDDIEIRIGDEQSSTLVVSLHISHERFARALGSLYTTDLDGLVNLSGTVGKVIETKRESLPLKIFSKVKYGDYDEAKRLLEPYEIDGWIGTPRDALNHHNQHGDQVTVAFHRWVEKNDV